MSIEIKDLDEVKAAFGELGTKYEAKHSSLETKLAQIETAIARGAGAQGEKQFTDLKSMLAVARSKDFTDFARKAGHGAEFEFKADVTSATTNGVFPIVDQIVGRVLHDSSPLATLVNSISIGNGAPYTKIYNLNDATSGWVGETGTRTATSGNTTHKVEIKAHELYAFPKVSLASIEDSFYDVEGELLFSVGDIFARKIATALLLGTGDGNNQPTGILAGYAEGVAAGVIDKLNTIAALDNDTVKFDDIVNAFVALPNQYKANASILVHPSTVGKLMKLENENGDKVWEQSVQVGVPSRIYGMPVYSSVDMPVVANNNKFALVGDFKAGATMVSRVGITITKDLMINPGYVTLYARGRYGSKPTDGRALVAIENTAS